MTPFERAFLAADRDEPIRPEVSAQLSLDEKIALANYLNTKIIERMKAEATEEKQR